MKLFFVTLFLTFFLVQTNFVFAEEITNFNSDITLRSDGSFTVVETIVYDFGTLFRHGIFRTIPTKHPQKARTWYKERYIDLQITEVAMDGDTVPYEVSSERDQLVLQIGNQDKEITGRHTYTITYDVVGSLSYFDNGTVELFWDVTGTEWEVSIISAQAEMHAPEGMLRDQRVCYVGKIGEIGTCKKVSVSTSSVAFSATTLLSGNGLAFAQELNIDLNAIASQERLKVGMLLFGMVSALLIGVLWLAYRFKTKHDPQEVIVSHYEPLPDFKPMFTGVLLDGRLDGRDLTACMIYLAEQGFLKIAKTTDTIFLFIEVDDYAITLLRPSEEVETQFQKEVLSLLFSDSDRVGTVINLSDVQKSRTQKVDNAATVRALRSSAVQDLEKRGYFERVLSIPLIVILIVVAVLIFPFFLTFVDAYVGTLALPLFVLVIGVLVIIGFSYQRRTRKGYEALNHLKGFKEFLSVTEKERYAFHNAPKKSPEQFMKFLPYAIAFGVEKEWADVFKDVTLPSPGWYDGGGPSSFNAVALGNDLGAFSTAFTRSTSSQNSASSGGGSVGGGGGGGSW